MKVREPIVEGIFYPSDRGKLHRLVTTLLEAAEAKREGAMGIVAPHAGYRYSGAIAASAFKAAGGRKIETVVILAPIHRDPGDEVVFPESDRFNMPSGLIPVDQEAIDDLLSCSTSFIKNDIPHLEEHCIEVQLPFVQMLFPQARIVPILTGRIRKKTVIALARALRLTFEKRSESTLFVVSANLTSFMQGKSARREADALLQYMADNDTESLLSSFEAGTINSCGVPPIATLLALADSRFEVKILSSGSSAETNHDFQELVHYAAVGFF